MSAGVCEEAAITDVRQDSVSESAVANIHMQDKRRWDRIEITQEVTGTRFTATATPFPPGVLFLRPMSRDSNHHFLPDLLLCPIVRVTPFVLAFHPAAHTHTFNPPCGHGGEEHSKLVFQVFHSILPKGTTQEDNFPQIKYLGFFPPLTPARKMHWGPVTPRGGTKLSPREQHSVPLH